MYGFAEKRSKLADSFVYLQVLCLFAKISTTAFESAFSKSTRSLTTPVASVRAAIFDQTKFLDSFDFRLWKEKALLVDYSYIFTIAMPKKLFLWITFDYHCKWSYSQHCVGAEASLQIFEKILNFIINIYVRPCFWLKLKKILIEKVREYGAVSVCTE